MFSWRQLLFFLVFFGLFFVLTMLGETDLSLAIMAIFTVFFFSYQDWLDFSVSKRLGKYLLWWLGLVIVSFASLFYTLSTPLSLYRFLFFVFGFLCFTFFLFLKKKKMSFEYLSLGFVVLSLVLSGVVLFLLIFPQFTQYLPDINVLVANYGHNHAAAIFLFTLPLAWYFALKHPKNVKFFLPFFIIAISLLLTFARVLILLGFAEVLALAWVSRKALPQKTKQYLVLPIGLAFGLVLSAFLFLAVWLHAGRPCPIPQLRVQLCKVPAYEGRLYYWSQAVTAITRAPVMGWGGGTFGLLSRQVSRQPGEYSSYVHNEYLQVFVEYGLVGGVIFMFGCGYFWLRCLWPVLKKSRQLDFYWGVGLLFSSIDALFDYNWSLLVIWVLISVSAALLIRENDA